MSQSAESGARTKLEEAELPGALALLDYLIKQRDEGNEINKIGSSFINTTGKAAAGLSMQEYALLPHFYLGRLDGKQTALEELIKLAPSLAENHNAKGMDAADRIFADFAEDDPSKWQIILKKMVIPRKNPEEALRKKIAEQGILEPELVEAVIQSRKKK